jgi:hypothetical protein
MVTVADVEPVTAKVSTSLFHALEFSDVYVKVADCAVPVAGIVIVVGLMEALVPPLSSTCENVTVTDPTLLSRAPVLSPRATLPVKVLPRPKLVAVQL